MHKHDFAFYRPRLDDFLSSARKRNCTASVPQGTLAFATFSPCTFSPKDNTEREKKSLESNYFFSPRVFGLKERSEK